MNTWKHSLLGLLISKNTSRKCLYRRSLKQNFSSTRDPLLRRPWHFLKHEGILWIPMNWQLHWKWLSKIIVDNVWKSHSENQRLRFCKQHSLILKSRSNYEKQIIIYFISFLRVQKGLHLFFVFVVENSATNWLEGVVTDCDYDRTNLWVHIQATLPFRRKRKRCSSCWEDMETDGIAAQSMHAMQTACKGHKNLAQNLII